MTTYYKTVIVWNKVSFNSMPDSVLLEIKEEKETLLESGALVDLQGYYTDTDNTVTISNKFTTREAAENWINYNNTIAEVNNLDKISSRIVSITNPD